MIALRSVVVVLLLTVGTGCAARSAREAPAPLPPITPSASIDTVWTADIGKGGGRNLRLQPAVVEGAVYTADSTGRVRASAADSGKRLWQTELDVPISGATGAGDGVVVVATRKGGVIALDRADGKERWRTAVSSEVLVPATAGGGAVVVQSVDGKLTALAAVDGKRLWVYDRAEPALSLRGTARPLVVDDVVVSGLASGRLVALGLKDGRLLWELPVSQPRGRNEIERLVDVDASPVVSGDMLFAASYHGKLIGISLVNGNVVWARDVSTYTDIAADDARVYVSDERGQVLAFDRASGASVWRQDKLRGRGLSGPSRADDYVVVGDFEGYLHFLAPDDGRLVARHRLASDPIPAPAITQAGVVYAAAADTLAALRPSPR